MKLSIIVVFHNMQREARRTLYSLSARYQTGVSVEEYEVIAIDNGSARPLQADVVRGFGRNFDYRFLDTDSVSPVGAVNLGAEMASGDHIAVIVDGARMVTPGLVGMTLKALTLFNEPFVCTLSWHLGPEIQNISMQNGYDQVEEDRLLSSIEWQSSGYRLFDISTLAPSSGTGFLDGVPVECSWLAMRRDAFLCIGGLEPCFQSPGGGLVNHDFRDRALAVPDITPVVLLGEGVFHQFHGGVATNVALNDHPLDRFLEEFRQIRGRDYARTGGGQPVYFGTLPNAARLFLN